MKNFFLIKNAINIFGESEWAVSVSSAWQSWAAKLGLCTPRCPDLPRHGGWNGEGVYGDCERLSGMREIAMCV